MSRTADAEECPPKQHTTIETLTLAQISLRRSTQRLQAVRAGRYSFVAEEKSK